METLSAESLPVWGRRFRFTEGLGKEKQCARCEEWWPADEEFFNKHGAGLHSWCKACCTEWRAENRQRWEGKQHGNA
jgi:hypothetical protein